MSQPDPVSTSRRRRSITPKQRVLRKHPEAFAHSWSGCWTVYSKMPGGEVLGEARSVVNAWKLADMRIHL